QLTWIPDNRTAISEQYGRMSMPVAFSPRVFRSFEAAVNPHAFRHLERFVGGRLVFPFGHPDFVTRRRCINGGLQVARGIGPGSSVAGSVRSHVVDSLGMACEYDEGNQEHNQPGLDGRGK